MIFLILARWCCLGGVLYCGTAVVLPHTAVSTVQALPPRAPLPPLPPPLDHAPRLLELPLPSWPSPPSALPTVPLPSTPPLDTVDDYLDYLDLPSSIMNHFRTSTPAPVFAAAPPPDAVAISVRPLGSPGPGPGARPSGRLPYPASWPEQPPGPLEEAPLDPPATRTYISSSTIRPPGPASSREVVDMLRRVKDMLEEHMANLPGSPQEPTGSTQEAELPRRMDDRELARSQPTGSTKEVDLPRSLPTGITQDVSAMLGRVRGMLAKVQDLRPGGVRRYPTNPINPRLPVTRPPTPPPTPPPTCCLDSAAALPSPTALLLAALLLLLL